MKDPQRLRDQPDLPDALFEALRGLGQDAPSADAVARIQRSLSALPVPPGPSGGASITKNGWSTGAFKIAAVAVGAVAAAIVATVAMRAPEPALRIPKPAVAIDTRVPLTVDRPAPLPAATQAVQTIEHAPTQVSEPVPEKRSKRMSERRAKAPALPDAVPASPVAPDLPVGQQARSAGESTKQLPAPEDEASLLYRAKKAARTDHRSALHLLEQHATHFPHGALVEEREVLAIDLLRRLGREPEAKQRAAQFLREFPQSSYRSAIAR